MAILTFEEVSLIRQKKKLLDSINWQIEEGEDWALLGLNGAGKTLLLQLISGNMWPTRGKLTVLNQIFGKTSIPDLTKRIGWVSNLLQYRFQQTEEAERIVLSGKFASIGIYQQYQKEDMEEAKQLLSSLSGKDLIGKPYQVLSQGERQVVLIARALMAKPELLILDEPCTGLDLFAREDLLERIQQIKQGKGAPSLLYVTHHTEEILPLITHVLMVKDGKIFKKGTREALITEENLTSFYSRPITIRALTKDRLIVMPKK
ncbi:ABC transporter ATP-binding protein [Enterococcus florum]|uniref:ABC transporter ATP-binding protein n=1 Tax=Enterococcus florum TaxID=2480627 RepID=A0A4P5PIV7_9ENTE|nr:ABC transporter ATP-binding protein [Enterococcus florum]GCF95522.1 ABC transporter ATP-binding protein [Enterococcus florum]